MDQCVLNVLVKPGTPPIRCRRKVWESDPESHACYACHPHGRDEAVERIVQRVLEEGRLRVSARDAGQSDQRENRRWNRRVL